MIRSDFVFISYSFGIVEIEERRIKLCKGPVEIRIGVALCHGAATCQTMMDRYHVSRSDESKSIDNEKCMCQLSDKLDAHMYSQKVLGDTRRFYYIP